MEKTILYLNRSYCASVLDVTYYLEDGINKGMQQELLAAFKDGTLLNWLNEKDEREREIASHLESIPKNLTDSKLLEQICKVFVEEKVMRKNRSVIDSGINWMEHVSLVTAYYSFNGKVEKIPLTDHKISSLEVQELEKIEIHFEWKVIRPCNEELSFILHYSNNKEQEKKLNLNVTKNSIEKISFFLNFPNKEMSLCDFHLSVDREDCFIASIRNIPERLGCTVQGYGFEMIRVEGGTFQMGTNEGDSDERPVHEVTLSDFYIGKFPVTQKLWQMVTGEYPGSSKRDDFPIVNVSWKDCILFCNKLSELKGREACYRIDGNNVELLQGKCGYRLPTESEWEFAARGGKKSKGFKYAGSDILDDVAWHIANSGGRVHSVDEKRGANELGLYDMSGNVWEWCWDWKGVYPSSSQANPLGPTSGSYRVNRGGSWNFSANACRLFCRSFNSPISRCSNLGFRLVFVSPV